MMKHTYTICPVYAKYPDYTEDLIAFVESPQAALEIDNAYRARGDGMSGTWEEYDIELETLDRVLYAVCSARPHPDAIGNFEFDSDPICHGIFATREEATKATIPKTKYERLFGVPKYVLPFRVGWKREGYFPHGKPWPPDRL